MNKILGYLRTSTDRQEINNQRLEIFDYAKKENLKIDDFLEIQISSKRTPKDRRIEELIAKLNNDDTLIVTELSRIGRSISEVIGVINELMQKNINMIIVKQNLKLNAHNKDDMISKVMITMLSLFAELERDLISQRTKDALRSKKASGIYLGKPKGTIQKSIYDVHRNKIVELLELGLSVRKIAHRYLGIKNYNNLNNYIRKRKLRSNKVRII